MYSLSTHSIKKSVELYNLHDALKPVNYIFSFLGIQSHSYDGCEILPKTVRSKAYSIICLLFILISYIYVTIEKINMESNISIIADVVSVTDHLSYLLIICATALSMGLPVLGNTQELSIKFFKNVKYVDTLMDLPKEYNKKMRSWIICVAISLCLIVSFTIATDIVNWYSPQTKIYIPMFIGMVVMDFVIIQYVQYIWIVTFRMHAVISQLICCDKLVNSEKQCIDFSPDIIMHNMSWGINKVLCKSNYFEKFDERILRLMSVYDKLADNVDIINSTYGIQVYCQYIVRSVLLNI